MSQTTEATAYLLELFRLTKGNPGARVSMYDVGTGMGLEKGAAGKLAEDLIAGGWVEIKSLSGGIGITAEGIAAAREAGASTAGEAEAEPGLETAPVLSPGGRPAVENILAAVKKGLSGSRPDYDRLEEMVIDIKTLEVQLLSPRPKTAILREGLASIQAGLKTAGLENLAAQVGRFIGKAKQP